MKKIFAMILVALMVFGGSVVSAESIDLSAMTQEELIALIDNARLELTKYLPEIADGTVLYEDENVRLTFTKAEIDDYGDLCINVLVENLSDKNINVALENSSCNGWALSGSSVGAPAGKKAKEGFWFYSVTEETDIVTIEDLQDIEADLYYYDTDTYDTIKGDIHVIWNF